MALEYKYPKNSSLAQTKRDVVQSIQVANPSRDGLGGKAGKISYAVKIGQVENLYITTKRHPEHNIPFATQYSSILDLHGRTKDEAITTLETALIDWMDVAMMGEYPWVNPAVIVCGGDSQILLETAEAWIKRRRRM